MKAKNPSRSQAQMIRALLAKKLSADRIVARVKRECGGNPTIGYVNWLARKA